jgi:hypothetical protein
MKELQMNSILEGLFARAHDLGVIDDVSYEGSSTVISCGAKKLTVEETTDVNGVHYLLWSSVKPETIYEVYGSKSVPLTGRLVMQYFMGLTGGRFQGRTYSNALLIPVESTDEGLVLSSADGIKYLLVSGDAGGNNANITLDFYNLVYDNNGEHWVMSLPQLYPRDKTKVGVKSSALSLDGLVTSLPASINSLAVCPRTDVIPGLGTCIQSGIVVTSSDTVKITDMNKAINLFLAGSDTSGYTVPIVASQDISHQDIAKEIIKSDRFKLRALDNGALQIVCLRSSGTRDLYSQFTAIANMFKTESYLHAAGVTLKQLKSGFDFTGIREAQKLKEFLVSSAKFNVIDSPEIQRQYISQGLVGDAAQKHLQALGFDTSLGVLNCVRQICIDGELPRVNG